LKLLYQNDCIKTEVASDYRDIDGILAADLLITYTCDVIPTAEQQQALKQFLESGKRWFALHGTNSIIEFLANGQVGAPRTAPLLMEMLGSQFLAHPPIQDFTVTVSDPKHPLVAGIAPFVVKDELYLSSFHGEIKPLLETRWTGEVKEFADSDWHKDEPRLVLYLHPYGKGEVLYFTLGHRRRRLDMQPFIEEYPFEETCSWDNPVMYTLLQRGLDWAIGKNC
jgi:type 1 glutamine amidotransferase